MQQLYSDTKSKFENCLRREKNKNEQMKFVDRTIYSDCYYESNGRLLSLIRLKKKPKAKSLDRK